MKPEFPRPISADAELNDMQLGIAVSCVMLRFGSPCGNETRIAVMFTEPSGHQIFVPFCELCSEEMLMSGPQQTAFWRAKQEEWGVR